LWPSPNHEDELECSLVETPLTQGIEYNALSYAWGENPVCNKPIRLNGKPSYATRELCSALSKLRSLSEPAILWVDAFCINQKSHLESNTQVLLMSSIYGGAKRVIIWLGPVSDELDDFAVWWVTTSQTRYVLFDLSSDEVDGLRELIARSWFRRIWVLQEFVLAREAHFVLGPYTFPAEKLLLAFNLLRQTLRIRRTHSVEASDLAVQILYMKQLYFYRQRKEGKLADSSELQDALDLQDGTELASSSGLDTSFSFLQLLAEFRHFQASKPHDKIYGLLGLGGANSLLLESSPVPDYDKPCMEVFKDWALYFIDQYKDISVLYSCRANADDSVFPSWVPDWRERRSTNFHSDLVTYLPKLRATKDFLPRVSVSACRETLSLEGILLDTLTQSGFTETAATELSEARLRARKYINERIGKLLNSRGGKKLISV
jgi:Heterokaryon incompatibility protein (HET)